MVFVSAFSFDSSALKAAVKGRIKPLAMRLAMGICVRTTNTPAGVDIEWVVRGPGSGATLINFREGETCMFNGFGNNCCWIIIILLLLFCCCGNSFGGCGFGGCGGGCGGCC